MDTRPALCILAGHASCVPGVVAVRCSIWPTATEVGPERARANSAAVPVEVEWSSFAAWLTTPLETTNKHEQAFSPLVGITSGKGGRVNAAGGAGFVALEYDRTATPELLALARERLAGHDAVIYTSASATPACPRFRVVLRPSRPIENDDEYRACVDHVGELLGSAPAPESRQRTRIWYRPIVGTTAWVCAGAPWDVDASFVSHPPPPPRPRPEVDVSTFPDDERVRLAWSALDRVRPEGSYHAALLCRDYGVAEETAYQLVIAYASALRWDFDADDLISRVEHAYEYAREEPGSALAPTAAVVPDLTHRIMVADPTAIAAASAGTYVMNDGGNADRLLAIFGANLRHAENVGWLKWDGTKWTKSLRGPWVEAEACAKLVYDEGIKVGGDPGKVLKDWGRASGDAKRLRGCLDVACNRPAIAITVDALDADPWVLNCPNGVLDLRTGTLRPHRREDLITHMAGVAFDPMAQCPRFVRFLLECMGGSSDLAAYLLRFAGYALTGSVREHALGVWHGPDGANGKSTLIDVLAHVMGDYHATTAPEVLLASGAGQHSTGLMDLRGRRLVTSNETPEGRGWNESLVKQLTGGDEVKARAMRQDNVGFKPTWKLVIATNTRPTVREQGGAFWRRVQLVPWLVSFRGREDKDLGYTLKSEAPGILALLARACVEWASSGLQPPWAVTAAGNDYRTSQDAIGAFLDEVTVQGKDMTQARTPLYEAYKWWATQGGEFAYPASAFYRIMSERGFEPYKTERDRGFVGLRLKTGA